MSNEEIIVTQIFTYPVKSMRAVPCDSATLLPTGLEYDRHWVVVKEDGALVSQRNMPTMARLSAGFDGEKLTITTEHGPNVGHSLHIDYADRPNTYHPAIIWGDEFHGLDEGDAASKWLTEKLEADAPVRLLRAAPEKRRPQQYPKLFGDDTTTYFADASPLSLANEASLDALNMKLEECGAARVPMDRFRPNIVVKGLDAFAENDLAELKCEAGGYDLGVRYTCVRCVMTTMDQSTGEKSSDQEPLRTLIKMKLVPSLPDKAYFAQNLVLLKGEGQRISVGDSYMSVASERKPGPRG